MKKISLFLVLLLMVIICCGCGEANLDPDRTKEPCDYYGEVRVFGVEHQNRTNCIPDGDGYYNPAFGHHHHK